MPKTVKDVMSKPKQGPVKVKVNNKPAGQFFMHTATPFKPRGK